VEKKTVDPPADTAPDVEVATQVRVGPIASIVLAVLGLAWLIATLTIAHASVLGNSTQPDVALGDAALALPNVIAAAVVVGATTALAATLGAPAWLASRVREGRRRLLTGLVCGAVLGGSCGGLVVYGYGTYERVAWVAATVGVGCLSGGAIAALPRAVLAAGLVATFGTLLIGLIAGTLQPGLVGLFGGRTTLASLATASWEVAYTVSIVAGLVAGILAFWFLRRYGSRAWPWYLLAGALPGLLLLVTELLTRTGGAPLLDVVRNLDAGDRLVVDFTAWSRLRNAMVVTFIGGLAAMVAVGRTLRAPIDDEAAQ
jgi:hypothetical protein